MYLFSRNSKIQSLSDLYLVTLRIVRVGVLIKLWNRKDMNVDIKNINYL